MKRALVTGAEGFLGRHFVYELLNTYDVWTIDTRSANNAADMRQVLPTLSDPIDVAVHAAAFVGGRQAIESRRTFLGAYNLQLDAAFFAWALRAKPRRVVYISSSAVYPIMCQDESAARSGLFEDLVDVRRAVMLQPDETYGFTKLVGERLARELADEVPGMSVHVVRPFSGYGADQDLDYPFPMFASRALRHADPFEVWGSGRQVRDWVHVSDVVGATLAAVEQDYRHPVNICTGRPTNFLELAEMFMSAAGYHAPIQTQLGAPTGVQYRLGNPMRMLDLYQPKISIEHGIAMAINGAST